MELNFAQKLSLIAAIITAVATYIFYWCVALVPVASPDPIYINGIGFIKNLSNLFSNPNTNANKTGLPLVFYYAFIVIFLILLASPILQVLGVKKRYGPLIGCIMPLLISLLIFFYALYGYAPIFIKLLAIYMGDAEPLAEGMFPITLTYEEHFELVGTYVLMGGGVISLIAGLKGSRKF